jgi:hypothetical protein
MSEEQKTTKHKHPKHLTSMERLKARPPRGNFRRGPGQTIVMEGGFRKNPRRFSRGEAKVKPEFDQKIISIRRVTRVVSGGRRFSFSVALVAGDKKGMVGVGMGKAGRYSFSY